MHRSRQAGEVKRSLLSDGANRHDRKLLCATLDGSVISRPEPIQAHHQHLYLDAGYDYLANREEVETHHSLPRICSREQEKQEIAVLSRFRHDDGVERTHSWLNRCRRLAGSLGKEGGELSAFRHLACSQLIFATIQVFGYVLRQNPGSAELKEASNTFKVGLPRGVR